MDRIPLRSRRRFFAGLGGALGGTLGAATAGLPWLGGSARAGDTAAIADPSERRLLFVVGATGGASIIDSFLPVATEEVPEGVDASRLNTYPRAGLMQPPGSNIRCVRPLASTLYFTAEYSLPEFLERHYEHMTVVTHDVTSVNHAVAQKRAMTGAGVNRGRTIAEAVAERHGAGLPLANCTMATGGYLEPGDDASLAPHARAELIVTPRTYAMSTHGSRGIAAAPPLDQVARARRIREQLEEISPFGQTFRESPQLQRYLRARREVAPRLEQLDAIDKLTLLPTDGLSAEYGLEGSPLGDEMRSVFPGLDDDDWKQQGALSFLLAYYGLTCASTLSLKFEPAFSSGDQIVGAPLAFDFSHLTHRVAQSLMWSRVVQVVDGLIHLLKKYDYLGDPALGRMWDRSLIYIVSDFGRDKVRPAGDDLFGSGHHPNNGSLLLSPLLKGNRIFGGVDPSTLLTHGFDGRTGEPRVDAVVREPELYCLVAQAMGVEFPGRRDMSGVLA